ncbi:MAG: hypothetical protein WCP63_07995 [Cyanobium sp. ELA712]
MRTLRFCAQHQGGDQRSLRRHDPDGSQRHLQLGLIDDDGVGLGMAIGPDPIGKTINPAFINQANVVVAFNRQLTGSGW